MSQKRYLQIKNFQEAQMYKDRNPIWIKLHCAILDDYEFCEISDETKFHAVALMILAARLNNKFPDDEAWLRRKINANSEINLNLLLEIGFLEPVKGARSGTENSLNTRKLKKTKGKIVKQLENENFVASHRTEQNKTEEKKTEHNRTDETRGALASGAENGVVVCVDFKNSQTAEESRKNSPNHAPEIERAADAKINAEFGDKANAPTIAEINAELSELSDQFDVEAKPETSAETSAKTNAKTNVGISAETSAEIDFGADENRDSAVKSGSLFTLEDCLRYVHLCETRGDAIKNPHGLAQHLYKTGASDVFIRHALFPAQQAAIEQAQFGAPRRFTDEPCRVCFGAKMADEGGKGYRKCAHCRDERGKSTGFEPLLRDE